MPHDLDLIMTLTGGLSAALAFGLVTQKLGLSPIVGYLLAGVLVGPFTPGFVAHSGLAEQLAEVGVILLMFGVGLHFHLEELLAVRRVALPGALVQVAASVALGLLSASLAGWRSEAGLVFGLAVSVASTVVLLRVLSDRDELHTRTGHVAVGWLVVEDILTVFVLVLLPVLVGDSGHIGAGAVLRATGAARTMVGVPTLPRNASTAFGPRSSPVCDTGAWPETAEMAVVGQRAGVPITCASTSARAACSANSG